MLTWLAEDELAAIPTSAFWNDEALEARKAFDIRDGDVAKLWRYLKETTTYHREYERVLALAAELGHPVGGVGLDVAAGVCWTTALLSWLPTATRVYAVDISRHRLVTLAPHVLAAFRAEEAKVVRALGSFYEIRLSAGSLDFCLMSQAFHHADDPRQLLLEMRRLLKPGSPVLVIGEVPVSSGALAKARVKNVVKHLLPRRYYRAAPVPGLWPSFAALFPADREGGDHYYRRADYERIFDACGFTLHAGRVDSATVFVAVRR